MLFQNQSENTRNMSNSFNRKENIRDLCQSDYIEITSETLEKLGVSLHLWDIFSMEIWNETIRWIAFNITNPNAAHNGILVKLEKLPESIDIKSIVTVTNIFKSLDTFKSDKINNFEDFQNMSDQLGSSSLESNTSTEEIYDSSEYSFPWNNHNFFINNNFWWKLHLNVEAQKTDYIWDFLKLQDLNFKYLSWWAWVGKTFTIYTWSMKKTREISKLLSQVTDFLSKPSQECVDEIEFWAGIVWRFSSQSTSKTIFNRYGINWMDMLAPEEDKPNYLVQYRKWKIESNNKELSQQSQLTFQFLSSKYWSYFHW